MHTASVPKRDTKPRIDWVDVGKGLCIVFVVMMHSTLGVEAGAGETSWMNTLVAFAAPFRMPDFFLIAGLFLAARIDRPWRDYLDSKVVHFAYFYAIWVTIQFALKAPGFMNEYGALGTLQMYLLAYVQPFGTLWFIYILPIFFVVTKLSRNVPWLAVWAVAAGLEIAPIHTGALLVDEFASRFVYFYSGYIFAKAIFRYADWVDGNALPALAILAIWGVINGWAVFSGVATLPVVSLALGYFGAVAVVSASVLLSKVNIGAALRYAGSLSIVVYLAFFLPMAVTRIVLLKTGIVPDLGTVALLVTAAAVTGPLLFHFIITRLGILGFLFARPGWARIPPAPREPKLVPAE